MTSVVRIHHLPPDKDTSFEVSFNLWWIRKPALENSPVDCSNRRGFAAAKRIHHLPPKARTYRKRCVLFVLSVGILANCFGYCTFSPPLRSSQNLAKPRNTGRKKNEKTPSMIGRNRFPEGILHYIFRFATTRRPGAYFSHFPLMRRAAKQIARHIQSPTMAIQMPIAPMPK